MAKRIAVVLMVWAALLGAKTRPPMSYPKPEDAAAFRTAWDPLRKEYDAAHALRKTDPDRWVATLEPLLAKMSQVVHDHAASVPAADGGARSDVNRGYDELARFMRFERRTPARAVAYYDRMIQLGPRIWGESTVGPHINAADTLRHDLGDKAGALRHYRAALAEVQEQPPSVNEMEASMQRFNATWMRAEIAFLETGTRYIRPSEEDCQGIGMMTMFAFAYGDPSMADTIQNPSETLGDPNQRRELARRLESLQPAAYNIVSTQRLWPVLETSDRLLAFVQKHDPVGFLTLCTLSMQRRMIRAAAQYASEPDAARDLATFMPWTDGDKAMLQRTADRLLGAQRPPDKRFATPESTWRTMMAAFRAADVATIKQCMTPALRNKFADLLALQPDQLREIGGQFDGFEMTGDSGDQAIATRKDGHAGFINFVDDDGEWKVNEM